MTYIEHIRNLSDGQLAYFLNFLQPEITLWSLAMERTLSDKIHCNGKNYNGPDVYFGLNGDARYLMSVLYKDYEEEMARLDECRNQSLDDLYDYSSGNDLKRALGLPTKERELEKAPVEDEANESDG